MRNHAPTTRCVPSIVFNLVKPWHFVSSHVCVCVCVCRMCVGTFSGRQRTTVFSSPTRAAWVAARRVQCASRKGRCTSLRHWASVRNSKSRDTRLCAWGTRRQVSIPTHTSHIVLYALRLGACHAYMQLGSVYRHAAYWLSPDTGCIFMVGHLCCRVSTCVCVYVYCRSSH